MKAFPTTRNARDGVWYTEDGMDLRDYFASKAMVALIPMYREMFMDGTFEDWYEDATADMVTGAYQIADAMMKEREVK